MSRAGTCLDLCKDCSSIFEDNRKFANGRSTQKQIFCTDVGYEYQRTREEIRTAVADSNCAFCMSIESHISGQREEALTCPPNTKLRVRLKYQQKVGRLMLYDITRKVGSRPDDHDELESLLISWNVRVDDGSLYLT
jgi:hypothetical protein